MPQWYNTGFDPAKENLASRKTFSADTLYRFWVGVGKERRIVFLDDMSLKLKLENGGETDIVPFNIREHSLKIDGDWKRPIFVTCTKSTGACECCRRGYKSQFVGALTILDITPDTDPNTGEKVVKPARRLMVATSDALVILDKKKVEPKYSFQTKTEIPGGNLQGCVFSAARHDSRHPRVGSDFDFEGQIKDLKEKFPGIKLDPYGFNAAQTLEYYKKIFTPLPLAELEHYFATKNVEDGFTGFKRDAAAAAKPVVGPDSAESIPF
jgi:hypothetical protein